MTPTQKQTQVLSFLSKVESATKSDIYQSVEFGYYYNWEKHFGDLLSRMVKNGMISRVKNGVYAINRQGKVIKQEIENPSQIKLL